VTSTPDHRVHLSDAAPFVALYKALFLDVCELIDVEQALPDRAGVTAYVVNHGSFVAPYPAPVLTVAHLLERGGYDDLVAVTLFHRVAEFIPGLAPVLRRFLGHSTREIRTLADLVALLRSGRVHLVGTAPEGWTSLFTWDEPVGPFTKVGLVVAALEAEATLVLAAQKGVEVFGRPLPLPAGLRLPLPGRPRGLLLPVYTPGRRASVRVKYERYEPSLSFAERSAFSPARKREWYTREIERVRRRLVLLYESIPDLPLTPPHRA
jgi:hypothetical protein